VLRIFETASFSMILQDWCRLKYRLSMEKAENKRSKQIKTWMKLHTMEKAEYAKSDAPKLTPSNTKAKQFRG
jgi:exoribonuclease R